MQQHASRPAGRADLDFAERLWPSAPTWLLVPGIGAGVAISTVPLSLPVAAVLGVLTAVLVSAGLVAASPRVEVRAGRLRAGRAQIPLALLGPAVAATGEQARHERGPVLDARAYLCIRGWVDPVVRIPLEDPEDPTPYWLVSTRRPAELVGALSAGR